MAYESDEGLSNLLLSFVPADGSTIGNQQLKKLLDAAAKKSGTKLSDATFEALREALVSDGKLVKGKGRGGSVRRAQVTVAEEGRPEDFSLAAPEKPAGADEPAKGKTKGKAKAAAKSSGEPQVLSYRHEQKRKNNPQIGLVNPESDPDQPKTTWKYDPHLDPALQFDVGRAQVEKLIDDALASGDDKTMRAALQELKRLGDPYLSWTGKAERTSFDVDTVSLYVHERIDPASILAAVRKRMRGEKGGAAGGFQPDLFAAAFENLPLRDAIDFYKHERGWANRLIAGDSLLVMNSLLQKESMAGQVQMIYIDPPYGIKYGSNFQPFVNKRDVKDRVDSDLTQEPEMIKAFRDTWELGIHSYLTYLRDRLLLAKELLHESGSIFVQISDENLHHVREVMDDVYGVDNFCGLIGFDTTTAQTSELMAQRNDFLLWYSQDRSKVKFRVLFLEKIAGEEGGTVYQFVRDSFGRIRKLDDDILPDERVFMRGDPTSQRQGRPSGEGSAMHFVVSCHGKSFEPRGGRGWSTTRAGMDRLLKANRLIPSGINISYVRYLDDAPALPLTAPWKDTASSFLSDKTYVVQTNQKVIERCLLMTTDPGDLVLDPTCGSGTTSFVAEKWGRRWITTDTSRVAVTLAKQRLMTASYDYYELKYPHEGLKAGFIYKTVPHVTLKSIANNPEIDEIYERMHPAIDAALQALNKATKQSLKEWEVPFDYPADWPAGARAAFDGFHAARQAMQKRMDESIAAHADQETLYDKPAVSKDKLRITGPFTVEAVPFATVLSLEEAEQPKEADVAIARSGESSRQHQWRDELLKTGIRGKGGQKLEFAGFDVLPSRHLHLSGTLKDSGERVVVSFGPEHAALEQRQVEMAMREAGELFPRPKMIVFCAFAFDPEAAKDIDQTKGITALKAQMNTDLLTEDLKKGRSSNQSFWLMGQPDVEVRKHKDGQWVVEVNGFDYFDTVKGELISGGKGKIAAWMLDTDYDERSLFPRQVFFPMAGSSDGWYKLKKDIRAELNEDLLSKFHGTVSLPFEAGENKKIAVKIVDDRGIESLKVIPLE
jgi:adenine-specific DNA-methyltransferase